MSPYLCAVLLAIASLAVAACAQDKPTPEVGAIR